MGITVLTTATAWPRMHAHAWAGYVWLVAAVAVAALDPLPGCHAAASTKHASDPTPTYTLPGCLALAQSAKEALASCWDETASLRKQLQAKDAQVLAVRTLLSRQWQVDKDAHARVGQAVGVAPALMTQSVMMQAVVASSAVSDLQKQTLLHELEKLWSFTRSDTWRSVLTGTTAHTKAHTKAHTSAKRAPTAAPATAHSPYHTSTYDYASSSPGAAAAARVPELREGGKRWVRTHVYRRVIDHMKAPAGLRAAGQLPRPDLHPGAGHDLTDADADADANAGATMTPPVHDAVAAPVPRAARNPHGSDARHRWIRKHTYKRVLEHVTGPLRARRAPKSLMPQVRVQAVQAAQSQPAAQVHVVAPTPTPAATPQQTQDVSGTEKLRRALRSRQLARAQASTSPPHDRTVTGSLTTGSDTNTDYQPTPTSTTTVDARSAAEKAAKEAAQSAQEAIIERKQCTSILVTCIRQSAAAAACLVGKKGAKKGSKKGSYCECCKQASKELQPCVGACWESMLKQMCPGHELGGSLAPPPRTNTHRAKDQAHAAATPTPTPATPPTPRDQNEAPRNTQTPQAHANNAWVPQLTDTGVLPSLLGLPAYESGAWFEQAYGADYGHHQGEPADAAKVEADGKTAATQTHGTTTGQAGAHTISPRDRLFQHGQYFTHYIRSTG